MTDERLETRGESQKGLTAVERATQMMGVPGSQQPELANEFAERLCREFGACGEVFVTAYAIYAQLVEGLACDDDLYLPRPCDREWFAARGYPQAAAEPSEPAAVDRDVRGAPSATLHDYSWSLNDEEFFGRFSTQREAIKEAVKHIKDQGYFQGEVRTVFVGANEEADDYLNEIAIQFADRFVTWMNEHVIHEFCWDDSPYDLKVGSESEFGKSLVKLMQKHGYFNQFRTANSRRFDIEITDIGWFNKSGVILEPAAEPSEPAAEPAGETA